VSVAVWETLSPVRIVASLRPLLMDDLVTPDQFRAALGRFASGVTVITVETPEDGVHGMTANAFCSVSLRPPLALVCIDHLAETYLRVRERGQFGVSVLKENQEALSEFFADPERNPDAAYRLGIRYRKMNSGVPVLEEALASLDCRVVEAHIAGDHTIFVGEVREVALSEGSPLLYFRGRYGLDAAAHDQS
jgi:flavin reductase (DIM6/NTAB) family NADH-FMN oxidoreductase RutF